MTSRSCSRSRSSRAPAARGRRSSRSCRARRRDAARGRRRDRRRARSRSPSRRRARRPGRSERRHWIVVDAAGGLLVGVIGARRPRERARLARLPRDGARLARRGGAGASAPTSSLLYAFWALLLAVPLAGNLGAAWLLVEATTAASALLVGFSGKARALEAGWKYLILTSLGLGVALLGDRDPRRGRSRRRARRALLAGALDLRRRAQSPRSSPTCCCSPGWPRRSAGRPCTTGCPTRTPRRRRRSRRCSRRRSCRRCCSSPGAREQALAPVVGARTVAGRC